MRQTIYMKNLKTITKFDNYLKTKTLKNEKQCRNSHFANCKC